MTHTFYTHTSASDKIHAGMHEFIYEFYMIQ